MRSAGTTRPFSGARGGFRHLSDSGVSQLNAFEIVQVVRSRFLDADAVEHLSH
jgi:hypothetical protein